jgi:CRISPR-associated protein Csx10
MAANPSILTITITAQSPLSFSQRKPGGIFQESLGYVPGTALRGAVALPLLHGQHDMGEGHPDDCDFCQRFVNKETALLFTNAYPAKQAGEQPRVLPATAVSCKAHSGFRGSGQAHGVFDTLLDRYCCEALAPAGLVYAPTCPKCQGRVERFSGFYAECNGQGNSDRRTRRVSQRLLTRVAINRRRGVAEEGMLYSPWVMNEAVEPDGPRTDRRDWLPATFVGRVVGADSDVRQALEQVTAVGGTVSQGLNQVKVEVGQASLETADDVERRITAFNRELAKVWAGYRSLQGKIEEGDGQKPGELSGDFFALTLQSDSIFCLPDGRPLMAPPGALLDLDSPIELVRSEAATFYGGGWNAAWGLPKPVELRVHMGAVYLFHALNGLTTDDYQALARCQVVGIGQRRAEGFGQVRICDEFHLTRWDSLNSESQEHE